MRALGLALVLLALSAPTASAAVIEIRENFCGCDGSSGDEDTRTLIVRANPGEANAMRVVAWPRGVVVADTGAELTGACRPATTTTGRFCRGAFRDAELFLGDGDDSVEIHGIGSSVEAGPGGDSVLATLGFHLFRGGPGADRLEAGADATASVSYSDHTDGVTVRVNDLADDGAPGEGDDVRGAITAIEGGSGDDLLESGPYGSSLAGGDGDDVLAGGPLVENLNGGAGDDELAGADGDDMLLGGAGADVQSGGAGRDQAAYYDHSEALALSIGDGANDGAPGEGDDIRSDVEEIGGGNGPDTITGDDGANGLFGGPGRDTLRGGAGADRLAGVGDGDLIDAGPGRDQVSVSTGGRDRLALRDGERDSVRCRGTGPEIEADRVDSLRSCAPRVWLRTRGFDRRGVARLLVRCDTHSTVRCSGRLSLWLHGKRVSRPVRFGPIRPGVRRAVIVRARRLPRPGGRCIGVRAVTNRADVDSSTLSKGAVCPRLPRRATG
jgi:RTX calcium-binding nonapeptide repeat (4 copies)